MCPDASNPVMVPAVKRLAKRSIKAILFQKKDITHKDRIQFHPAGAPVPLSGETLELGQGNTIRKNIQVIVKTSLAERKPYVLETPIGSQIRQNMKSTIISPIENLNTIE